MEAATANSVNIIPAIHAMHAHTRILVIAHELDLQQARTLLKAGATGYILMDDLFNNLDDVLRTAYGGKWVISTDVTRALL
jgi:DNA-binding NarL/FixJ family response regulator